VVAAAVLPPPCPPLEVCIDDDEDIESPPAPDEVSPDEALLSAVEPDEVVAGVVEPQPIRSSEEPKKRSAEVRMGPSCRLDSFREQPGREHGACPRCARDNRAEFRRFSRRRASGAIGRIAPG
jgi:hypothetical protein